MRDSAITYRFHRSVWVLSAALAVLSVSLVVAAGCATGTPNDPAETGGTGTAWISTAGQDAPEAAARFFYSDRTLYPNDPNTPWDETRTVWNAAGTLNDVDLGEIPLPANSIGIETLDSGVDQFTKSANDNARASNDLTAAATFRICNNLVVGGTPREITVSQSRFSDPGDAMEWMAIDGKELQKTYDPSLRDWLFPGQGTLTGPWGAALGVLWGGGGNAATINTAAWTPRITAGPANWASYGGWDNLTFSDSALIPHGQAGGSGTLTFGISTTSDLGVDTANIVVALFTMNFGLDVGFTY